MQTYCPSVTKRPKRGKTGDRRLPKKKEVFGVFEEGKNCKPLQQAREQEGHGKRSFGVK